MADPLSAAGTAVGVVSLGLQVFQGLIKYYSHFKAHDEDIAHLVLKSESLQSILQSLDGPLRTAEAGPGNISTQVRNAVNVCETRIRKLLLAVQKYGNLEIPVTREERLRAIKKRALYPFKQTTLQELNLTLEGLTIDLQLALQVLSLETSRSHKDAINEASSSHAQHFSANLDLLSTKMDQLILSVQSTQARTHLYREPALLASMCREQQELRGDAMKALKARARRSKSSINAKSSCHCYPQIAGGRFNWGGWSTHWSNTTQHLPNCPHSRFAQRQVNTLGVKYTYCTRMLGYSIVATFSVERGAGGLSISPHLMLRAVVPWDSPAFHLLDLSGWYRNNSKLSFSNPFDHVNWIIRQLNLLFQDGKASPTDVTSDGATLLHYSLDQMGLWRVIYPKYESQVLQVSSHLIDGLLRAGANPLERDSYNRTIIPITIFQLSIFADQKDFHSADFDWDDFCNLLMKLFDCGLAFAEIGSFGGPRYVSNATSLIQNTMKRMTIEQSLGTLEVPDILEAIYRQDHIALEKAIARYPKSVNQPDCLGLTPLHISLSWPEGLLILLKRGAEPSACDGNGSLPLKRACNFQMTNDMPALLLLEYDCPVGGKWDQNGCLTEICCSKNLSLKEKFVSCLAERRKRLFDFALKSLPAWVEPDQQRLKEDRILDAQAADVTRALLQHNIDVDPALMPSFVPKKTTVYHSWGLDISTASFLHEAGFNDIDESDDQFGLTPFWLKLLSYDDKDCEWLEVLHWLKAKGVDIFQRHPRFGGTAVQALGAAIGRHLKFAYERPQNTKPSTKEQAKITGSFMGEAFVDRCQCACSKEGCRIITSALKSSQYRHYYTRLLTRKWDYAYDGLQVCIRVIQIVEANLRIAENAWIPAEVIRIMTFEWLELTHTCHVDPSHIDDEPRGPLAREEIHEIQEEERFLLQQHEDLVAEFEAKYTQLGIPLTDFMKDWWKPVMEKVLKKDEIRNVEEEKNMRQLGIVVEERDRVEEVESDEDEEQENEDEVEDADAETGSENEDFHDCEDVGVGIGRM